MDTKAFKVTLFNKTVEVQAYPLGANSNKQGSYQSYVAYSVVAYKVGFSGTKLYAGALYIHTYEDGHINYGFENQMLNRTPTPVGWWADYKDNPRVTTRTGYRR